MKEKLLNWITENRGLFWGIVIGLAVAILFLTIGFFPTLLIALCVGVGAFLGSRPDIRERLSGWFLGLFEKKER
ncbi:MAG: DUF2273 domain-containing protein [Christensenellaceae bacterium]